MLNYCEKYTIIGLMVIKTASRIPVKTKLHAAFWKLLEEKKYTEITVKDIVLTANVDRSAFYYYYSDLQSLATDVITHEHTAIDDLFKIAQLTPDFFTKYLIIIKHDPQKFESFHHCVLINSPHSTLELSHLFKDYAIETWLSYCNKKNSQLTIKQTMLLDFMVSGMLGSLKDIEKLITTESLDSLSQIRFQTLHYILRIIVKIVFLCKRA